MKEPKKIEELYKNYTPYKPENIADEADITGFDEMQKAQSYTIAFKTFWVFFYVILSLTAAIAEVSALFGNIGGILSGVIIMSVSAAFYIIYLIRASSLGIMNFRLAEKSAKNSVLALRICIAAMLLVGLFACAVSKILPMGTFSFLYIILTSMGIAECLCAKRNMRVLEKIQSEDGENE